jgi:two-component system, LuxR family, sensor kinase FixL
MAAANMGLEQRAHEIGEEARSIAVIFHALRLFANDAPVRVERVALSTIAEWAVRLRRYSLNTLQIEAIVETVADPPMVLASRRALMQIVMNLLVNAEQALAHRPGARVRLRAAGRGESSELTVEDNGPGLSTDPPVWSPEVLAGADRLGIGLRVSEWLAGQQGGCLSWRSPAQEGIGFAATLSLPAATT